MWLVPEAAVVKVSATCTPADAAAGGTPRLTSKVVEITPKAIPSAPSISWATNPTAMKAASSATPMEPKSTKPLGSAAVEGP
jgi:hypothetical protein